MYSGVGFAEAMLILVSVGLWIFAIAAVIWVLLAIRDIRHSLRKLVRQQGEMLLLHREWHRLAQRMWADQPSPTPDSEPPGD